MSESAGEKMTFRRRPIPRRAYAWLAENRGPSLRYRLSEDGSYRIYPDGREVCVDSYAGRREYLRRLEAMLERQGWRCILCCKKIRSREDAFRDDRIVDSQGQWRNGAAHWICNHERG